LRGGEELDVTQGECCLGIRPKYNVPELVEVIDCLAEPKGSDYKDWSASGLYWVVPVRWSKWYQSPDEYVGGFPPTYWVYGKADLDDDAKGAKKAEGRRLLLYQRVPMWHNGAEPEVCRWRLRVGQRLWAYWDQVLNVYFPLYGWSSPPIWIWEFPYLYPIDNRLQFDEEETNIGLGFPAVVCGLVDGQGGEILAVPNVSYSTDKLTVEGTYYIRQSGYFLLPCLSGHKGYLNVPIAVQRGEDDEGKITVVIEVARLVLRTVDFANKFGWGQFGLDQHTYTHNQAGGQMIDLILKSYGKKIPFQSGLAGEAFHPQIVGDWDYYWGYKNERGEDRLGEKTEMRDNEGPSAFPVFGYRNGAPGSPVSGDIPYVVPFRVLAYKPSSDMGDSGVPESWLFHFELQAILQVGVEGEKSSQSTGTTGTTGTSTSSSKSGSTSTSTSSSKSGSTSTSTSSSKSGSTSTSTSSSKSGSTSLSSLSLETSGAPCNLCSGGNTPKYVLVTISGITKGSGSCNSCDSFNGTYLLGQKDPCIWEYYPLGYCLLEGGVTFTITDVDSTHVQLNVTILTGQGIISGSKIVSKPLDCKALNEFVSWQIDSSEDCDYSGGGAQVVAVS